MITTEHLPSPVFPGETQLASPAERAWGGTPAADRELGAAAWEIIVRELKLHRPLSTSSAGR